MGDKESRDKWVLTWVKKFWLFYWCKIKVQSIIKNLSFKVICLCFLTNARQGTSASGARHIRIWEEAHPYLGGDAPVSGTRDDRIWDLKRLNARRCSPTNRDTKFSCCFFYDCCLVKLILIDCYILKQRLSRPPFLSRNNIYSFPFITQQLPLWKSKAGAVYLII